MINKDLSNSPAERERAKKLGAKQDIVTQFEKEFKEATGECTRLLARTRQLSFKSGTANKATFEETFRHCIEEIMEINDFQRWALTKKKNEWNEMIKLQGID
jgi:hypothetical protein